MRFNKIEFWVVTLLTLIFITGLSLHYLRHDFNWYVQENSFLPDFEWFFRRLGIRLVLVLTVYSAFSFLNFYILPTYFSRKRYDYLIVSTILTFILVITIFTYADYFLEKNFHFTPISLVCCLSIVAYLVLKKVIEYGATKFETPNPLREKILRELGVAFVIWLVIFFVLVTSHADTLGHFWAFMVPYGYLLFLLNVYWLIPESDKKGNEPIAYFLKMLLVSFLVYIPFGIAYNRPGSFLFIFFWSLQQVTILPLSWYVFKRNKEGIFQLLSLKKELGQTTADLQFLRTQINPHFLFNALNTLYGTALLENSERTSEGILKLGDMMRFMLQENHQDKIQLGQEINYMRNYIDLQLLRIQPSPDIRIETSIKDTMSDKCIAPMLLIPFVENAFKHGISQQHKSWIKISLSCSGEKLYLDVYNSLHAKNEKDPEKDRLGVGLENVKQRLLLLYPGKHELVVRETTQEYFVHLTLTL